MTAAVQELLTLYEERVGVPLVAAAETGEYAWGVEDDNTPHRVTAVRVASPVRHADMRTDPRRHRTNGADDDPLAVIARENGVRNDIELEVHDCASVFKDVRTCHPRIIHLLQSDVTYRPLHPELQTVKQHVWETTSRLKYGSQYLNYAHKQAEEASESSDPLTVGEYIGIVASAARAHYIVKHSSFPPMHIDAFRETASQEIRIGAEPARLDEAVATLRRDGRSARFSDASTVARIVDKFAEEPLRDRYDIESRVFTDIDVLNDALSSLYEEFYGVER